MQVLYKKPPMQGVPATSCLLWLFTHCPYHSHVAGVLERLHQKGCILERHLWFACTTGHTQLLAAVAAAADDDD